MWRIALFATVVALLPRVPAGDVARDPEEAALQRKLWQLEGELWETEQAERHRIHKHHRRPLLGLLRRGVIESKPEAQGASNASKHKAAQHKRLRSSHPVMRNLRSRKNLAADARLNLEGRVKDAIAHLNSVGVIKSELTNTEVQLRVEGRKLNQLELDQKRLDRTHHELTQSLHHIMDPKLAFAEERLLKKERRLNQLQAQEAAWKQAEDNFHTSSLAMIKARDEIKANLESARVAEERAHQDRLAAEKQFTAARRDTNQNIQNYRVSETKERASKTKEQHGEEQRQEAQAAVNRLTNILNMEQHRVDESMALSKDRVNGKINELEAAKEETLEKLSKIKSEYMEWQQGQQAWKSQLSAVKEGTRAANQNYADAQKAMFAAQRDRIVVDGEKKNDWAWDEWPVDEENDPAPGNDEKDDAE